MTKIITTALLFALSATTGCIAYAHPPNHQRTAPQLHPSQVRAWVWTNGYYWNGSWRQGYWEVRVIHRTLLSSKPRTHIRWVEGRQRPARPDRRHRRRRGHR